MRRPPVSGGEIRGVFVAHLLPGHDPVHKVTIVPRGRALGVTWTMPDEDQLSQTREQLIHGITMAMGGRAAYTLMTEVIKRATGTPFPEYQEEHLHKKLGQTHSFVQV